MQETLVLTDGNLEEVLLASPRPLLIECWAPACKPCQSQRVIIEKMVARGLLAVQIARLDAQSNPEAAAYFELRAVPAVLLVRGGVAIERAMGLQSADEIADLVRRADLDETRRQAS